MINKKLRQWKWGNEQKMGVFFLGLKIHKVLWFNIIYKHSKCVNVILSFCHFVIFHVALGGYIGGVGVSFIYLYIIYYIYYILYISRPRKIEKMTKWQNDKMTNSMQSPFLGGYSWKDDWNTISCAIRAKSCEFISVTHARVPRSSVSWKKHETFFCTSIDEGVSHVLPLHRFYCLTF